MNERKAVCIERCKHGLVGGRWNRADNAPRQRPTQLKDCIGKARGYLSAQQTWQQSGKKKGKPGVPTASNHPRLYRGTFSLELDALDLRESFVRLKVYTGTNWVWVNYPTRYNRYFEQRRMEPGWEQESPTLVLHGQAAWNHH